MAQKYFCKQTYWKRSLAVVNSSNKDKSKKGYLSEPATCADTGKHQTEAAQKLMTVYGQKCNVGSV
jgi:hypothetical protein